MDKLAGTCYVKVDGEMLLLQGSLALPLGTASRETIIANGKPVGYSETEVAPYISGTFVVNADFPLETLVNGTAMTVTAECANGLNYTLSDAYLAGDPPEWSPQDNSTVTLRFEGKKGAFA
ncbi:phage tail tube protein [Sutterella sp.]|uniref:phage tail tube protein n=1 Tax=Sutterella sp. TaxID=1981025 RepID=UPI0026DFB150|nr:phage tail tube protein [Sutterella sp.]MDO5531424.1 phage tail tube protein [Sutterella sp.]